MADINLRVRSDDGGRFQSIGEASERLTFAVWALVQRGDGDNVSKRHHPAIATDLAKLAVAFDEAAARLLVIAGTYHERLEKVRAAQAFRCEVVRDLHLHKDLRPVARSCEIEDARLLDEVAQFERTDKIERELVSDVTLAVYLLREDIPPGLRAAVHTSVRAWQLVTLSFGRRVAPQADATEHDCDRLHAMAEELHDIFHAIGRAAREKRGGGGYDDPKTPVLDALGEEEEIRDALPLRDADRKLTLGLAGERRQGIAWPALAATDMPVAAQTADATQAELAEHGCLVLRLFQSVSSVESNLLITPELGAVVLVRASGGGWIRSVVERDDLGWFVRIGDRRLGVTFNPGRGCCVVSEAA